MTRVKMATRNKIILWSVIGLIIWSLMSFTIGLSVERGKHEREIAKLKTKRQAILQEVIDMVERKMHENTDPR